MPKQWVLQSVYFMFHQKINFKEDWKLITILVGGSDLCQYCLDKVCISELGMLIQAFGR